MEYKASLDKLAKVTTLSISILFAIIIGVQFLFVYADNAAVAISTTALLLLIYFGTFCFRPISYRWNEDALIIRRPLTDVRIKRSDIRSVELLDKNQLRGVTRMFGVGGLFGYWGRFSNRQLGSMVWYATRRDRGVLILMNNGKKVVVTPYEGEGFVGEWVDM